MHCYSNPCLLYPKWFEQCVGQRNPNIRFVLQDVADRSTYLTWTSLFFISDRAGRTAASAKVLRSGSCWTSRAGSSSSSLTMSSRVRWLSKAWRASTTRPSASTEMSRYTSISTAWIISTMFTIKLNLHLQPSWSYLIRFKLPSCLNWSTCELFISRPWITVLKNRPPSAPLQASTAVLTRRSIKNHTSTVIIH